VNKKTGKTKNTKKSAIAKKGIALKIIIPILIVFVLTGLWIIKNNGNNSNPENEKNPDFALLVTQKLDIVKLKSYGVPIVIDFGSDSCIPCQLMAPVLEELNSEYKGRAIVRFVDVWKYPSFADGYPISTIPTQIFIDAEGNPYKPKDSESIEMKFYSSEDTKKHIFTAHLGGLEKEQLLSILKEMGLK
jgi:thioredoxin 1